MSNKKTFIKKHWFSMLQAVYALVLIVGLVIWFIFRNALILVLDIFLILYLLGMLLCFLEEKTKKPVFIIRILGSHVITTIISVLLIEASYRELDVMPTFFRFSYSACKITAIVLCVYLLNGIFCKIRHIEHKKPLSLYISSLESYSASGSLLLATVFAFLIMTIFTSPYINDRIDFHRLDMAKSGEYSCYVKVKNFEANEYIVQADVKVRYVTSSDRIYYIQKIYFAENPISFTEPLKLNDIDETVCAGTWKIKLVNKHIQNTDNIKDDVFNIRDYTTWLAVVILSIVQWGLWLKHYLINGRRLEEPDA